jgi:hypothetical protein
MNRRLTVVLVLAFSIAIFATFIVLRLIYGNGGSHHHNFIRDIVLGIAFMLGIAGIEIMKSAGYRKITKYFLVYSFAFVIAFFVLILVLHLARSVSNIVVGIVYYSWYAALAGLFPLSLYLKFKKKRSSIQTTVADAS